jgi:hypothetical protein
MVRAITLVERESNHPTFLRKELVVDQRLAEVIFSTIVGALIAGAKAAEKSVNDNNRLHDSQGLYFRQAFARVYRVIEEGFAGEARKAVEGFLDSSELPPSVIHGLRVKLATHFSVMDTIREEWLAAIDDWARDPNLYPGLSKLQEAWTRYDAAAVHECAQLYLTERAIYADHEISFGFCRIFSVRLETPLDNYVRRMKRKPQQNEPGGETSA